MIEKLKSYLSYIFGLAILVLSTLLFRKSRQEEQTKSELASALTNTEIKLNDVARENARDNADKLVDDYHKLRGDDR